MSNTPGQSQRQLRVGEQIRHVIAETLRRGHFHNEVLLDAAPTVTVSEVRVSPDLKNATAYVTTLGGINIDAVLPALNDVAHVFQKDIGRTLTSRNTPRVKFVADNSFAEAEKIERILKSLPKTTE
jgi:ribosome-binding factor A